MLQYELNAVRLEELKQTTRCSLRTTKDTSILLNLIDSIQRLGVSYHLENDIKHAISRAFYSPPDLHHQITSATTNTDLYTTALRFRVLRQHGFSASSGNIYICMTAGSFYCFKQFNFEGSYI